MARLSKKREQALLADIPAVRALHKAACLRWGPDRISASPSLVWTMRCIEGVQGAIPFVNGLISQNAGELLWVLRTHIIPVQEKEPSDDVPF